jgi:hypothetical protein
VIGLDARMNRAWDRQWRAEDNCVISEVRSALTSVIEKLRNLTFEPRDQVAIMGRRNERDLPYHNVNISARETFSCLIECLYSTIPRSIHINLLNDIYIETSRPTNTVDLVGKGEFSSDEIITLGEGKSIIRRLSEGNSSNDAK